MVFFIYSLKANTIYNFLRNLLVFKRMKFLQIYQIWVQLIKIFN